MNFRIMCLTDYDNIISLWQETEGLKLRDADSKQGIKTYLNRNPELSFVCEVDGNIVGTIMSGHDGKRGYIQHLAVDENVRKQGVGEKLIEYCLEALRLEGILKSHIHVLTDNTLAQQYWSNRGWKKREDILVYSFINSEAVNT